MIVLCAFTSREATADIRFAAHVSKKSSFESHDTNPKNLRRCVARNKNRAHTKSIALHDSTWFSPLLFLHQENTKTGERATLALLLASPFDPLQDQSPRIISLEYGSRN